MSAAAIALAVAMGASWLVRARLATACKMVGCNPRFLAVGFAIWWPANVLGDGMPIFVLAGTDVAYATLAMTLGNVVAFLPWPTTPAFVRGASALGLVAIALAFAGGDLVIGAAALAGITGTAATSVVWGVAKNENDVNVKSIGLGMTLSAVVSSLAVLVLQDRVVYCGSALVVGAAAAMVAIPKPAVVDTETLLEETKPDPPPAHTLRDHGGHAVYFAFYALAYALPGLLPRLALSNPEYRAAIVAGTAGDVIGRLFADKTSTDALLTAAAAFAVVAANEEIPAVVIALVFTFYLVRGDAVTAIQLHTKNTYPAIAGRLGVSGQLGAAVGAAVTAAV